MEKFCSKCGKEIKKTDNFCPKCGYQLKENKSKELAGVLGLLLGGFGVHSFYLGDIKKGITQIVVTICTAGVGAIVGIVEGALILTGTVKIDAN